MKRRYTARNIAIRPGTKDARLEISPINRAGRIRACVFRFASINATPSFIAHACIRHAPHCDLASLRKLIVCLAIPLTIALGTRPAGADQLALGPPVRDPAKVVGADQCAKCHAQEIQQWMRTSHFATFDTLHRTPEAKQIAQRLGLRSIKRNSECLECHYTQQDQGGRVRVVSGVSCESCHGAAADWLAVHADYGGGATKETESPAHRRQRLAESIDRGMNNPHNVYLIARQCYDCHTIPHERLVNVGGHSSGSSDFELVSWSQGMVRHNFLRTGGAANGAGTPAELRVMYVVGVLTDLEYSLRAVAKATEKAPYGIASAQRAARMKRGLHEIQSLIHEPRLQPALDAVSRLELTLDNSTSINEAADAIGKTAYEFAEHADGSDYSALDPVMPQASGYKH